MPEPNNKKELIFRWHKVKIEIQLKRDNSRRHFYEKEIWWANLGANIGHEEDGKNEGFERPVLILRRFNAHLILVIPLSSKSKQENKYYFEFLLNSKPNSVIISQIRAISSKRLSRMMGRIDDVDFERMRVEIKRFL